MTAQVYTDGSRTPKRSGWGTVVIMGNLYHCLSGSEEGATNNKMEATAFLEGLKFMKSRKDDFHIYSDSQYVLKTLFEPIYEEKNRGEYSPDKLGWIKKWDVKDDSRANIEIFREILRLLKVKKPSKVFWVRGHQGILGNEIADRLSNGYPPVEAVLGAK